MTKKECFNCHNTKEGLTVNWWDKEDKEHIEFCCWDCAQNMVQQELNKCAKWERNKKKIFRETLQKAKNKENFDWPFRFRNIHQKGSGRWDRITICCNQYRIMLDWEVTAYEDSRGKCSQCRNCQEDIKRGEQDKHFSWKDDNTPSYICPKSVEKGEIVCHMCDKMVIHKKGMLRSQISDLGGTITSGVVLRQNSKGHLALCTKRHADNFKEITREEWADILPVLKDTINKIDKAYNPIGYKLSVPIGPLASQNPPHFYMRIVPKYKEAYGSRGIKGVSWKAFSQEGAEQANTIFQPTEDNIVAEKSKVSARSHNEIGGIVVFTKNHLPNDINAVDQETWDQIGEVCQELIQKMASAENFTTDAVIRWEINQKAAEILIKESEMPSSYSKNYPPSEFSVYFAPRFKLRKFWRHYRPVKDNQFLGTMEDERMAEKIRDPEAYYQKWGKTPWTQLKNQLNKNKREKVYLLNGWLWNTIVPYSYFGY